eukprot:1998406-Amphidinium_carterae.1
MDKKTKNKSNDEEKGKFGFARKSRCRPAMEFNRGGFPEITDIEYIAEKKVRRKKTVQDPLNALAKSKEKEHW